jgi:aryl-alcohol dehydrogenase-like predicted oxidoreductase
MTPGQLALAWVLAQGEDVIAIPGTRRRSHLEENVEAAALRLDTNALRALEDAVPAGSVAGERWSAMDAGIQH